MGSKTIHVQHTTLHLLPEKVLHLPDHHTLCVADWHLGKAAHFRKSGIPFPQPNLAREFETLSQLIGRYAIEQVVLLGDVFHSRLNKDWQLFTAFIASQPSVTWVLTLGNHDIISRDRFEAIGVQCTLEYQVGKYLVCSHDAARNLSTNMLHITGHIHPGCEIKVGPRQHVKLPCFYYENTILTLPAFGSLTGLHPIRPQSGTRLFPIVGNEVKELR